MILTGGAFMISLSMAVVVELGKYFLTVGATRIRDMMSPMNLWLYRILRWVMVSFSFIASLFFFSQFLNDHTDLSKVQGIARQEVNVEFDKKAQVAKDGLLGLEKDKETASQRVGYADPTKEAYYRHVQQERSKATKALEQERLALADKLQAIETERARRLDLLNNPSVFGDDDRTKNQSLNAMVQSIQKAGIPISYHGILFTFCLLISIFLEILIHISAVFPASIGLMKKKPTNE
jgi:hypothetical protein